MYSQSGRQWHQTWSRQKNLKSSRKLWRYSRYCKIIPRSSMCLLSKALGKTILWAYIIGTFLLNERDTSPEFFGLSSSALECCVPAYGALKLAVKAGITSCWPGSYLVCAVFFKNRNLHIKNPAVHFSWTFWKTWQHWTCFSLWWRLIASHGHELCGLPQSQSFLLSALFKCLVPGSIWHRSEFETCVIQVQFI